MFLFSLFHIFKTFCFQSLEITNLHNFIEEKNNELNEISSKKLELGQRIEMKNNEISKLREKISELNNSSFDRFEELNASLSNAKQKEILLNFQEKNLQNEKEVYKKQIEILTKQMSETSQKHLELQKQFRDYESSTNNKFIEKNSEIVSLTSENLRLKAANDNVEKNLSNTFSNYQKIMQEHSNLRNDYVLERDSLQNANRILVNNLKELEMKFNSNNEKLCDIQRLFDEQSEVHDQLQERFLDMKSDLLAQIEILQNENEQFKNGNNLRLISASSSVSNDDSQKKLQESSQQIHELEYENRMLSTQVQHLLKSGLENKGIPVFSGNKRNLSSNVRIPEEDITFSDIVQLQERNIELLKTLQIYYEDSDILSLKQENETLKSELEEKNKEILKNDSYCWQRKNQELTNEVKRLEKELEVCSKTRDEVKLSSFEEIRELEKERNRLFSENSILSANLSTFSAENEANKNNLESLESIKNAVLEENHELRDMNTKLKYNNDILEFNEKILKEDLEKERENLKESQEKIVSIESSLHYKIANENKLNEENAQLKNELDILRERSRNFVPHENSSMLSNEAKEMYESRIKDLRNNNEYYRTKIDRQEKELSNRIEDFTNRIQKFQAILEKEKARYTTLQKEFFDLDVKYQELLEKNAQVKPDVACSDYNDDPSKAEALDIYRLKEIIKIAEDHAAANEKAKLQLESGLKILEAKHSENIQNMQSKIDAKQAVIDELKGQLLIKDDDIEAVEIKKDLSISQLRDEIKQWKDEVNNLNNNAEVSNRSMENILSEQEKMVLEADGLRQLNLQLKNRINSLEAELNRSEAALKVYKDNSTVWESDVSATGTSSGSNENMEKEYANLKEYSDILLWQIEDLKTKVNESSLSSGGDGEEKGLMKVVKFLREKLEEAQSSLRNSLSEMNSLKIQNSNLNKEIELLKISFKKNNQSNSFNEESLKDLYGKASLAGLLSAKNAKLNFEFLHYQNMIRTLKLKNERAEKYQDEAQDMIQKARERAIENKALKSEILNYKNRMAKLETRMSQVSVETFEALSNEKEELEKKVKFFLFSLFDFF